MRLYRLIDRERERQRDTETQREKDGYQLIEQKFPTDVLRDWDGFIPNLWNV